MIGYEFEFLVREKDHPLTKKTFARFHDELKKRGWTPQYDPGTGGLVGSQKGDIVVTTDDGVCIMEINFPPQKTIHECDRQMRSLIDELQKIYRTLDCSIIGLSAFPGPFTDPLSSLCAKSYIKHYNPIRFKEHWQDLLAIASHHVWLDVAHQDLLKQWQFFNRLTPVLIALFANGPIFNMQKLNVLDGRHTLWHNMLDTSTIKNDGQYYGMPKKEFATLCDYFDFMLSMPFYFTLREGKGVSLTNKTVTYRQFFELGEGMPATYFDGKSLTLLPTAEDFFRIQQLTFPHTRIKYKLKSGCDVRDIMAALNKKDDAALLDFFEKVFLECRAIGAQPLDDISAGPSFLLGLQTNFGQTAALLEVFSYDELLDLNEKVLREGLNNPTVYEVAGHMIECAKIGLSGRGFKEEILLDPLFERLEKCRNRANEILSLWENGGLEKIYENRDF